MVTIVKRPIGHKIIDQVIAATIIDSGGDALVTMNYHSLSTGDYIYLVSDIEDYNGFWYVTSITADTFKISEYEDATFVEFYQEIDIDYYQTQEHDWNSIFLPIVYKATNDRWPINTIDIVRTITSFSDDNGYTTIVPSGTIKSGMSPLEYVEISGSIDEDLNGVWQLIETIGGITINLPYDAANSLVGTSVQFYYNNYQVNVKIYAGLNASHPWEAKKTYLELAELSLTPDADGVVMFSVSDYIKSRVAIKNNTLIFSYPLNLDAFTGFYISVGESYDDSDGYTITTNRSAFDDDTFEGYAIAGKLPFKNVYSGDYADYVYTTGSPARWLTLFERLLAVDGLYFDISFIKNVIGDFTLTLNKYVANYLTSVEVISFTDQGIGVYRVPIMPDAAYDAFCVFISTISSTPSAGVIVGITLPALSTWTNSGGAGDPWTTGATPTVNLVGGGILFPATSEYLIADYAFIPGKIYKVGFRYTKDINSGSSNPRNITLAALDSSNNVIFSQVEATPTADGTQFVVLIFTATSQTTRLGITATDGSDVDIDINAIQPQLLENSEFDDASVWTPADWVLGSGAAVITIFSGGSGILLQNIVGTVAGSYSFIYTRTSTNYAIGPDSSTLGVTFYDDTGTLIGAASYAEFISGNNSVTYTHTFTTVVPVRRVQVIMAHGSGSDMDNTFSYMRLFGPPTEETPGVPEVIGAQITEEMCIDIIDNCEVQDGFTPDEIRLLEDGDYRLLE